MYSYYIIRTKKKLCSARVHWFFTRTHKVKFESINEYRKKMLNIESLLVWAIFFLLLSAPCTAVLVRALTSARSLSLSLSPPAVQIFFSQLPAILSLYIWFGTFYFFDSINSIFMFYRFPAKQNERTKFNDFLLLLFLLFWGIYSILD